MNCLKRNPVTAAKQFDDVFKQLWIGVVLSGIASYCLKFEFWELKVVTKKDWIYACPSSCSRYSWNWWKWGQWGSLVHRSAHYTCFDWLDKLPWNKQLSKQIADVESCKEKECSV